MTKNTTIWSSKAAGDRGSSLPETNKRKWPVGVRCVLALLVTGKGTESLLQQLQVSALWVDVAAEDWRGGRPSPGGLFVSVRHLLCLSERCPWHCTRLLHQHSTVQHGSRSPLQGLQHPATNWDTERGGGWEGEADREEMFSLQLKVSLFYTRMRLCWKFPK